MKILWINASSVGIAFWRLEQIAGYMFDNWREKSPIGEPVYPHVEYFFNPASGIAWDHFIQYKDSDENANLIDRNLEAAFNHFDVIICQALGYKWGLNRLIELKAKYPHVKLLMEIDDCFDEFTPSNHSKHLFRDHFNIQAKQANISDAVITTNNYLGAKMSRYCNCVYVLPNAVYKSKWIGKKPKIYKRPYVDYAFVGGGSHDEDLKIAYRAMVPLMNEGFKFGIYYGSYRPEWMKPHENLIYENWSYHISEYYQQLLNVNCGAFFAPLRDTEFNRCKSDIKIAEAQMCGKKIICSNVGPYKRHKKTYLANNETNEWVSRFRRHREAKPSQNLSKKYKTETYAEDFLRFLKSMVR